MEICQCVNCGRPAARCPITTARDGCSKFQAENIELMGQIENLHQWKVDAVLLRSDNARLKGELEAVKSADSSGRWMAVERLTAERDALRERLESSIEPDRYLPSARGSTS